MSPENTDLKKLWDEEVEKCKKSPYYFMKKYVTISGAPFETSLTEDQYNDLVLHPEKYYPVLKRNRI